MENKNNEKIILSIKEQHNIIEFQNWVKNFYHHQKWDKNSLFVDSNFLLEEFGEVALALIDNSQEKIKEEVGDLLSVLFFINSRLNFSADNILLNYKKELLLNTTDIDKIIPPFFMKITIQLSSLVREIRRIEIGRDAHEKDEIMSLDEKIRRLQNEILNSIHMVFNLCNFIGLDVEEVLNYHRNKLEGTYQYSK